MKQRKNNVQSGPWFLGHGRTGSPPTQTSLSNQCYTNVRAPSLLASLGTILVNTLPPSDTSSKDPNPGQPPRDPKANGLSSSLPHPGGATQQSPGNSAASRDPHPLLRAFPEKGNRAVGLGANPRQSWMWPKH